MSGLIPAFPAWSYTDAGAKVQPPRPSGPGLAGLSALKLAVLDAQLARAGQDRVFDRAHGFGRNRPATAHCSATFRRPRIKCRVLHIDRRAIRAPAAGRRAIACHDHAGERDRPIRWAGSSAHPAPPPRYTCSPRPWCSDRRRWRTDPRSWIAACRRHWPSQVPRAVHRPQLCDPAGVGRDACIAVSAAKQAQNATRAKAATAAESNVSNKTAHHRGACEAMQYHPFPQNYLRLSSRRHRACQGFSTCAKTLALI